MRFCLADSESEPVNLSSRLRGGLEVRNGDPDNGEVGVRTRNISPRFYREREKTGAGIGSQADRSVQGRAGRGSLVCLVVRLSASPVVCMNGGKKSQDVYLDAFNSGIRLT